MPQACKSSAFFTARDASNPVALRARLVELYPDLEVRSRDRFRLAEEFLEGVRLGQKKSTVRYTPKCVEYPSSSQLPIYTSDKDIDNSLAFAGRVGVFGMRYKTFGSLNISDAEMDGFRSVLELKETLNEFYGYIQEFEILSIFMIACDQ